MVVMQATYKTRNGRIAITVTGETQKALFAEMAQAIEVFDADEKCGKCGSPAIVPRMRVIDDNAYYEIACTNQACRATLSFGQTKKGDLLFVKRKDKEDNWLPDGGWHIYRGTGAANSGPSPEMEPQGSRRAW